MRRTIIAVTAIVVLGAAAAAYAATQFNTYSAKFAFSPNKPGTKAKPSPMGFKETLTANGTKGNRAAPLIDLKSTTYGMTVNTKGFPTCSLTTIANAKNDTGHPGTNLNSGPCPSGALVATANVNSLLGPGSDPSSTAKNQNGTTAITPCNPGLDVWNEGGGKLAFFFWSTTTKGSAHYCGGVATGSTPPYQGSVKQSGKNLVIDVPLPPSVSSAVLGGPTWGSLIKETITWKKLKHGNHAFFASVACKKGKRPWTQKFTANFLSNGHSNVQSATKTGTAKCS